MFDVEACSVWEISLFKASLIVDSFILMDIGLNLSWSSFESELMTFDILKVTFERGSENWQVLVLDPME